jgi:hypothetical protein
MCFLEEGYVCADIVEFSSVSDDAARRAATQMIATETGASGFELWQESRAVFSYPQRGALKRIWPKPFHRNAARRAV